MLDDDDDDDLEILCANIRESRKEKEKKRKRILLLYKATTNSLNGWDFRSVRSFAVKEQMQKRNARRMLIVDQIVEMAKNSEMCACL
jgi:hypothetical protein